MKNFFVFIISSIFVVDSAFCQVGSLDPSFGTDGLFFDNFGLANPEIYSIYLQPDGKILIGGSQAVDVDSRDIILIRLLNNGLPDEDFGSGGLITYSLTDNGAERIIDMTTGTGGAIYLTGYAELNGNTDIFIAALLEDGNMNTSFGNDGIIFKAFSNGKDLGNAIRITPENKILIAGNAVVNHSGSEIGAMVLLQLNIDGSDDLNFGDGAKVISAISEFNSGLVRLGIQPNGKIVGAGFTVVSPPKYDFGIVRYLSNGQVDSSFGENGVVVTDFLEYDFPYSLALDSLDHIIVAGQCNNMACVARYLANGDLDPTFGVEGKTTLIPIGSNDIYRSMVLLRDNRMIIGGFDTDFPAQLVLFCLRPDGEPDIDFGEDGILTSRGSLTSAKMGAMTAQPDGRIITVGLGEDELGMGVFAARFYTTANTSINDINALQIQFTLSPNPAQTEIFLQTEISELDNFEVSLFDIAGKLVLQPIYNIHLKLGIQTIQIPLDGIANGIYQVRLVSQKGSIGYGKVIVWNK